MSPDAYDIKREIGIVMQNVAVYNELTVYENIDYFCGLYVEDKKLRKRLVEEAVILLDSKTLKVITPKTQRRLVKKVKYCLRDCSQAQTYYLG